MDQPGASGSAKRKRTVLTIEQKIEIIKQNESGENVAALARRFGIGRQTVRDIVKNKTNLQAFLLQADSTQVVSQRKTMKASTFEELEQAMIKWFLQKRAEGTPISGPMCLRQAQLFHEKLNPGENFKASNGWLYRFKKRHGIRELSIEGEKLSADEVALTEFCYELENIILERDLKLDQVYNADETGLFWKTMPTKTLAHESEKCASGFKTNKDRVTILCCANATGRHKLRLTVIGKSKNPRAFKNINRNNLPVDYYNQKSCWMTRDIFREWFFKKFIPQVRKFLEVNKLPPKALLLLDNATVHMDETVLKSEDGSITAAFFPPYVTSIGQPMDQGVIENMKRYYRKKIMMDLLQEDSDPMTFWKNLNIKDAIYGIAEAWSCVKDVTIKRAFLKILTLEDVPDMNETIVESEVTTNAIANIASEISTLDGVDAEVIDNWIHCDFQEHGTETFTEEEIIAQFEKNKEESGEDHEKNKEESDENDDIFEEHTSNKITNRQALEACNTLIDYFENQDIDDFTILNLQKMKSFIRQKQLKTKKQTKLTAFFVKHV
ncbi:hypothetical protein Zmor_020847 [Zophobas morio]|uniref:Uncharacterized protein n=1 Tax=Zophobas morio TaxID=2755281 RepID=A0AA38MA02_9CUCU|nr:hypothetical protein Zmor_020847 [Zophobas morio]